MTDTILRLDLTRLSSLDLADPLAARKAWDTLHAVSALQGLVNRDEPRLVLRFMGEQDDFWWEQARQEGGWLQGRPVIHTRDPIDAFEAFDSLWQGFVEYPEEPWAASNVASTIAGVEDLIPVRSGEIANRFHQKLLESGLCDAKRTLALVDADGKAVWDDVSAPTGKTRAMTWLIKQYVEAGRCDPSTLGHYIDAFWLTRPAAETLDNCQLTNHDYFIARRGCFFDLSAWADEPATDDFEQPDGYDLFLLRRLLKATRQRATDMIHVGGFTPWRWKYSDVSQPQSKHDGVRSEWKLVKEISAYDAFLDADAISYSGLANASFFQHFPLKSQYAQSPQVSTKSKAQQSADSRDATPRVYVMVYMGDYDAAAWLTKLVPRFWSDPARGRVVCNWAFNPTLDLRAPHVMDYVRTHAGDNDYFISGNCGAGYLNASELGAPRPDPDIPDGWARWSAHNAKYYARWGLDITGFVIEGLSSGLSDRDYAEYSKFSSGGLVCHRHAPLNAVHKTGMPYTRMTADLAGSPAEASTSLLGHLDHSMSPFHVFRTVIQSPSWHEEVMRRVQEQDDRVVFTSAPDFFALMKANHESRLKPTVNADAIDRLRPPRARVTKS